ncbi:hypothetical protein [Candidatus Williamhamiltonella defendens]|uniref:hypothetical protein n=1 Tax=Candidatus Williamhamiltonella defendens TaxID=138072 RepID=UPI000D5FEA59|nr:hypothetical protein [Candidatus Hamiltonella defensa]AWK17414.1 hypothetical protein CCS40_10325 [Candidatus Hamiltonella defensa]
MKTTKTILTKIVHILIVIFAGKTPAFFTETVAQGTTVSGEIVAPKEWDGLNRNNQRVFGTVTDTVLLDDNKDLSSIRSEQDIYSGGHTNNITVRNKRNQNILGGIAENTVIEDGGRAILEQGEFTNGKGEKSVIVEGGEITHGAKGVFMGQARINNLKISGDVGARASRENPHFSHAYIGQLGQLILSAGKITESTIEGGLLSVAYSEASDTTMKGGSIELGEGAF